MTSSDAWDVVVIGSGIAGLAGALAGHELASGEVLGPKSLPFRRRVIAVCRALLQDAMPRPGLPLVHFNDRCCGSVAELRSIILKARRLADHHAEQEQAAAAAKTWLLAQIEKKRAAPAAPTAETTPDERFIPSRLAA